MYSSDFLGHPVHTVLKDLGLGRKDNARAVAFQL